MGFCILGTSGLHQPIIKRKTTAAVRGKKLTQDRSMEAILRYKDIGKADQLK
jgi:hypothetical protein